MQYKSFGSVIHDCSTDFGMLSLSSCLIPALAIDRLVCFSMHGYMCVCVCVCAIVPFNGSVKLGLSSQDNMMVRKIYKL